MKKGVSLKDIADKLKMDRTAVSKVINEYPGYMASPKTRKIIFQTAKQMGYDIINRRHPYRRKQERIPVNIPAEILIKTLKDNKLFNSGKTIIKDISDDGKFITNIQLQNNCLPVEPFICELKYLKGAHKETFKGKPVRIGFNGKLFLGLKFVNGK